MTIVQNNLLEHNEEIALSNISQTQGALDQVE